MTVDVDLKQSVVYLFPAQFHSMVYVHPLIFISKLFISTPCRNDLVQLSCRHRWRNDRNGEENHRLLYKYTARITVVG
jgi:hypothetical protein